MTAAKPGNYPKYQTCRDLISYLPANIKVVIQEDPLIAALIADVRQAGCLALEHVFKQRLKATESGALVKPCAGGKLVLLQLHRLCRAVAMNTAASIQLQRLLNAAACVADGSESHASY